MKKSLLIWPPLISVYQLPLGIPYLVSYLKNNGIDDIEVIDLNMAYLKKSKLFFFLYILNKRFHHLAGHIKDKTKNAKDIKKALSITKNKSFLTRVISYSYKLVNKIVNGLLDYLRDKKKASIPWSLESILSFGFVNAYKSESKKIYPLLSSLIKEGIYSLIGISVIYPEQLFFAFLIAKIIKEKFNQDIKIVLGGTQITKHIGSIINSQKAYDLIDFLVTGDGEESLTKLIEELPKEYLFDIPNLYFKAPDKIKRYEKSKTSFRLYPQDFLVPDFMGFDLSFYRNQLPLLASKGCFWSKCNFCTYASMQEHRFCISPLEKVLETIKELKSIYGISNYRFVDDALPPKFMKELAENLSKEKLNIRWASSIILSQDFADKDFCKRLKDSGLFQVSIGLESVSGRVLKLMNKFHKDIIAPEIEKIFISLKDAGIRIGVHIIFGFPTETTYEARQTLNFLIKNKDLYDTCMFQPFCLEDNTPIFNNPQNFEITKIYEEDKSFGERLGYRYEVAKGMSQEEALNFTYKEAAEALKKVNVSARSSKIKLY